MRKLDIQKTQFKISDFVSWQSTSSLDLSPEFQRRSVWNKNSKSFLIDTIINGYPVPIIFIREKYTSKTALHPIREIVDGQQRLRTLFAFIDANLLGREYDPQIDDFSLNEIHNSEFGGKKFSALPKEIQRRILNYQFSTHVLSSDVSDAEVYQIFSRMNSTGVKLNDQELRNADYYGAFKHSVYTVSLSKLQFWREWKIFTPKNLARMNEVELTSDLYNLMINGIQSKNKKNLDTLYSKYDESFPDKSVVEDRFHKIISALEGLFDTQITETKFSLKNMFYILFMFAYEELYGLNSNLTKKKTQNKLGTNFKSKIFKINEFISSDENLEQIEKLYSTRRISTDKVRRNFLKSFKNM